MRKGIAFFLALCMCAALLSMAVGCNGGVNQPTVPSLPSPPPPAENTSNPIIHADVTGEELLGRFGIVHTFGNDEFEDYILWCEAEMTDFYIVALDPNAEGWSSNGEKLFEAAKIATNEAINYKRMVPEGFPSDAIVYTANGTTYMFAVSYNGRDGGITLIQIDRLNIGPSTSTSAESTPITEKTTEKTTAKTTATTTTTAASEEFMAEIFWVSDDLSIFAREMYVESSSKWHVWKALKSLNKQIPSKCSLLSAETVLGRNGVLVLDFSKEFEDIANSMTGRVVMEAIANTYISAYDLTAVRFTIEGQYFENAICGYAEEFGYTDC